MDTQQTTQRLADEHPRRAGLSEFLRLAAWAALVCGLVEGAGLLLFQKMGWLNWHVAEWPVAPPILWASPAFDLLLFLGVGLVAAVLARMQSRLGIIELLFGPLLFLTLFDWLGSSGRIRLYGVVVLALGLTVMLLRRTRLLLRIQPVAGATLPWLGGLTLVLFVWTFAQPWLMERWALARLPQPARNSPNGLLVVIDTLRSDRLMSYGCERNLTPNLDRIASRGVLFENAISTSSWTLPAFASILTGRFPFEHGVARGKYHHRFLSLPEALAHRGYRTGAISANLEHFGFSMGLAALFSSFKADSYSLSDMAARTFCGRILRQHVLPLLGYAPDTPHVTAEEVTRSALSWLQREPDRPFFLVLNYFDVHHPYRSGGRPKPCVSRDMTVAAKDFRPGQLQCMKEAYDQALEYVDENIGSLLIELEQRRLSEATVVIITSDHGELLGEHGLLYHRNGLYRELIHVPLIISWSKEVPPGVRISSPVSLVSLPATVLELTGVSDPKAFPGPSLVTLWRNPALAGQWPSPISELAQFPFALYQPFPSYHAPWLRWSRSGGITSGTKSLAKNYMIGSTIRVSSTIFAGRRKVERSETDWQWN